MSNIILIGMPSSGKSTVGKALAKTIGMNFVDTDRLIEKRENMKLQEIINLHGNDYFGKVEETVLIDFEEDDCIVATGGSAIYYEDAIKNFKKNGIILYLEVTFETVLERLNNIKTRGVTLKKGQTLEDLYKERVPLYEKYADITVKADEGTVEETIKKILNVVKNENECL